MKTRPLVALALFVTVVSPRFASAAPSAGPSSSPTVANPAGGAPAADPNIDRGFLLPTAMSQPAGSATYSNYELLLHGFTYGLTDRVQATVTALTPVIEDLGLFGLVAVKGQVVATPRFYLALQASAGHGRSLDKGGITDRDGLLLGAGVLATACLRDDCSSLLSASATYQRGSPFSAWGRSSLLLLYGGSIVHAVASHLKLLGEVVSAAVRPRPNDSFDNERGAQVSYGLRLHYPNVAGDVGFIKAVTPNGGSNGFILGLPFVNLSYRWE